MLAKVMYRFSCYLALYLEKYLQYSIDITTEQSFRYMEFIDAKIWISKNVSLCRVFANQVTFNYVIKPYGYFNICNWDQDHLTYHEMQIPIIYHTAQNFNGEKF